MHKNWAAWQVSGFLFTSILGTFLHFLFDITGGHIAAGLFSAVNESIWEHMKLIFYPMVLFTVLQWYWIGRDKSGYWSAKLVGLLLALTIIPVVYYTYTGILGTSADWFNIAIFFLAAGAAYWVEYRLLMRNGTCRLGSIWSIVAVIAIGVLFTVFTFYPPRLPLFQDPISGTYGYYRW